MIKKKQKTNYLIVFLIIAVLAVVVIQQTSPQVTRAIDFDPITRQILNFTKLLEETEEDLIDLQTTRFFSERRRAGIDKALQGLADEARLLTKADDIQVIRLKTIELFVEKRKVNSALGTIYQEIVSTKTIINALENRIEKLGRRTARYLGSGAFGKLKTLKNPFLICVVGITYFCFGVDPVLAAIDEASPDPQIPDPADFAEEELKAFEKAREGVLEDLDEIFKDTP